MAAKDYKICCGMFKAYIAKTSKKIPNLMLDDRREVSEEEVLSLIDWYMESKNIEESKSEEDFHGLYFKSNRMEGKRIKILIEDM